MEEIDEEYLEDAETPKKAYLNLVLLKQMKIFHYTKDVQKNN